MPYNGKFHDPFCKKEFWINHLSFLPQNKLENCLMDFEMFKRELEQELRFAMSPARADICKSTLEELLRTRMRQLKNENQGELF